jgi:hypothetical protein
MDSGWETTVGLEWRDHQHNYIVVLSGCQQATPLFC